MFAYCERFGNIIGGLTQHSGYDKSTTKSLMKIKLGFGFFQIFYSGFISLALLGLWLLGRDGRGATQSEP